MISDVYYVYSLLSIVNFDSRYRLTIDIQANIGLLFTIHSYTLLHYTIRSLRLRNICIIFSVYKHIGYIVRILIDYDCDYDLESIDYQSIIDSNLESNLLLNNSNRNIQYRYRFFRLSI